MIIYDYIIISGCLLGLAILYFRLRNKNYRHTKNIKASKKILSKIGSFHNNGAKINYLRCIDPFVFEEMILTAYQNKGLKIRRNKKYTGDGGIDGQVFIDKKLYLIQAKRYSSYINPYHVSNFSEVIKKNRAAGGFFIHTGKTGKKAHVNLDSNIKIISGEELLNLLNVC